MRLTHAVKLIPLGMWPGPTFKFTPGIFNPALLGDLIERGGAYYKT